MVTRTTIPKTEWSNKLTNMELDMKQLSQHPIAVISAVSEEMGLDLYMLFKKSVNADKFCIFLNELRSQYPEDRILLELDNLSVHRSKKVRD